MYVIKAHIIIIDLYKVGLRQKFSDLKLQFVNLKSLNFIAEIVWIYVCIQIYAINLQKSLVVQIQ